MRFFYKEEPERTEKSKQLSERLRKIDPKPDSKEIQKVEEKILAKHLDYERALKLRDYDAAYRLRFEIESLYGEQTDIKQRPWKERDSIIRALTELNSPVVENSCNWLMKEIKDLDFMLEVEILEKIWNPVTNTHRYRIKNNFAKVREIQAKLLEAKTKIQSLLGMGSIAKIDQIYTDALSLIPSKIACGIEEKEVDETTYQEMMGSIPSGPDKPSDWLTFTTMARYIP